MRACVRACVRLAFSCERERTVVGQVVCMSVPASCEVSWPLTVHHEYRWKMDRKNSIIIIYVQKHMEISNSGWLLSMLRYSTYTGFQVGCHKKQNDENPVIRACAHFGGNFEWGIMRMRGSPLLFCANQLL